MSLSASPTLTPFGSSPFTTTTSVTTTATKFDESFEVKEEWPSTQEELPHLVKNKLANLFDNLILNVNGGTTKTVPNQAILEITRTMIPDPKRSIKETLCQLLITFEKYRAFSHFRDLVSLFVSCQIDRDFLVRNGVPEKFFFDLTNEDSDEYEDESMAEGSDEDEDVDEDEEEFKPSERRASHPRSNKIPIASKGIKKGKGKSKGGKKKLDKKRRQRKSPDKWTPEEDMRLMELVNKYGVNTKKWRLIANELGTSKTSAKCAQHWRRVLAPSIHKGSWTEDEERSLLKGVALFGTTQWTNIAKDIPGRTDIQCRYHYLRQKSSREQEWNDAEDEALAKLVRSIGDNKWVEVSDTLACSKLRRTPRTALECLERWDRIK